MCADPCIASAEGLVTEDAYKTFEQLVAVACAALHAYEQRISIDQLLTSRPTRRMLQQLMCNEDGLNMVVLVKHLLLLAKVRSAARHCVPC
jgi:hypothetical protein